MMPLLEGETRHLPRPLLLGRRRVHRAAASQRPEIWIGGGSQLADPKSPDLPRFVESVKARTLRADGWIPRPTCPPRRHRARLGASSRSTIREHGRDPGDCVVAHENFLHLVLTNDPAKAREEQHRAFLKVMSAERGAGVPRVRLPVRHPGRGDRVAAGARRRGRRVLRAAHDDARPGAAPALGRRDHPQRDVPGDAPGPVAPDRRRRRCRGDAARRPARQAAPAAPLAGHARRGVRRGRHRRALRAARARARRGRAAPSRAARGPDWLGLGVTAPYKRVVAGLVRRGGARRGGDRRGQQRRRGPTTAGWSASTPMRPGSAPGSSSRWAGRSPGATSSSPGPGGAAHAVVFACLERGRARG